MRWQAFLVIILFLLSCTIKNNIKKETLQHGKIVVIIEKPKVNNRYILDSLHKLTSGSFFEVTYIDDQLIKQELPLNYNEAYDTIIIRTTRSIIEFNICYKAIDQLIYFFKNGDTVNISYNGIRPVAVVRNRKTLAFDINYDIKRHENIYKNNFSGIVKHDNFIHFIDFNKPNLNLITERERIFHEALIQFGKEYEEENLFLDSLQKNEMISNDIYNLYRHSLKIDYEFYLHDRDIINAEFLNAEFSPRSDSSLFFDYYRSVFSRKVFSYFEPKVNRIITEHSNMANYKAMFDSVYLSKAFTESEEKVMLSRMLEWIIKENSADEISMYLEKFLQKTKDSAIVNHFVNTFNLNRSTSNQLQLKDTKGNILNLEKLIQKHNGKLIYIDIWASWCAPCLASIPYAKELKNQFKDSSFVFLSLSLDENFTYWLNTLRKDGIEEKSYIIENRYVSQFLKDINLTGIPRYLLYDRKGKLVEKNAPGPKGPEIRKLLNKYIKE